LGEETVGGVQKVREGTKGKKKIQPIPSTTLEINNLKREEWVTDRNSPVGLRIS